MLPTCEILWTALLECHVRVACDYKLEYISICIGTVGLPGTSSPPSAGPLPTQHRVVDHVTMCVVSYLVENPFRVNG